MEYHNPQQIPWEYQCQMFKWSNNTIFKNKVSVQLTTTEEVCEEVSQLSNSTAEGNDEVPMKILQEQGTRTRTANLYGV